MLGGCSRRGLPHWLPGPWPVSTGGTGGCLAGGGRGRWGSTACAQGRAPSSLDWHMQGRLGQCCCLCELLGTQAFPAFSRNVLVDSLCLSHMISGMQRSTQSPSLSGLPSPAGGSAHWDGLAPDGCLNAILQEVRRSSAGKHGAAGDLEMSCVSRG